MARSGSSPGLLNSLPNEQEGSPGSPSSQPPRLLLLSSDMNEDPDGKGTKRAVADILAEHEESASSQSSLPKSMPESQTGPRSGSKPSRLSRRRRAWRRRKQWQTWDEGLEKLIFHASAMLMRDTIRAWRQEREQSGAQAPSQQKPAKPAPAPALPTHPEEESNDYTEAARIGEAANPGPKTYRDHHPAAAFTSPTPTSTASVGV